MKLLKLLIIAAVVSATISCKKGGPAPATGGNAQIIVKDGATGNVVAGASVSIYQTVSAVNSNTPEYTATTDASGKAVFTITNLDPSHVTQLYVLAQKGNQKNYFSGLIPVEIFTSTTDIQDSAVQSPAAQIGDVKFLDLNHDGQINSADDTTPPIYMFGPTGVTVNSVTIY